MKGSMAASAIAWIEAMKWSRRRLERYVDTFVCPSQFMADKMAQGGFDRSKLQVLNNFVTHMPDEVLSAAEREDYYCYVGRLSAEKGVGSLLQAASCLPHQLVVAGSGPMEQELREKYARCSNIEFRGHLSHEQVADLLSRARLSVIPSECYDNNPLSVAESLCAGTPVAGSNMGGIPELIDSSNGIVFQPWEQDTLETAITMSMARDWDYAGIASKALQRFAPSTHLETLMRDIYQI